MPYREAQEELIDRVKQAAALPVIISIKDVYDDTCTELLVLANLDSGARGRPRVTYDVTAALNAMQLCVFMADVYIEQSSIGSFEQQPQEWHRFLVHCADGCRLSTSPEKRYAPSLMLKACRCLDMFVEQSPVGSLEQPHKNGTTPWGCKNRCCLSTCGQLEYQP